MPQSFGAILFWENAYLSTDILYNFIVLRRKSKSKTLQSLPCRVHSFRQFYLMTKIDKSRENIQFWSVDVLLLQYSNEN